MKYKHAEVYLYHRCTYSCGYCLLSETGQVLDSATYNKYKNKTFVNQFTDFFNSRTERDVKWKVILTGGEPTIMPNFEYFCDRLFEMGNKVSLNTNMSISKNHRVFRYLLNKSAKEFDYMMISFHPQAKKNEDDFFEKLSLLKDAGHFILCKLVAHPKRMNLLEHMNRRCKELDICFFAASFSSKDYPQNYTVEEVNRLRKNFSSLSQNVQLFGGVYAKDMRCKAGSDLICLDMETGKIRPCINISGPYIGDFFKNKLTLYSGPISCPSKKKQCSCYAHFQQDILIGAEDSKNFNLQKQHYIEFLPIEEQDAMIAKKNLIFCNFPPQQGQVEDDNILIIERKSLRKRFEKYQIERKKANNIFFKLKKKLSNVYHKIAN